MSHVASKCRGKCRHSLVAGGGGGVLKVRTPYSVLEMVSSPWITQNSVLETNVCLHRNDDHITTYDIPYEKS